MDLNEAIQHCNDVASTCNVEKCRQEHRQLAEWLKMLKRMGNDIFNMRWLLKNRPDTAFEEIKKTLSSYDKQ